MKTRHIESQNTLFENIPLVNKIEFAL